jgi:hypothetical protein
MEILANVRGRPDILPDERRSHELIMRILKLRWMGMDGEAKRIELELHRVDPACTILASPFDTD